jgi:hypothetical protein
MRNTADVIGGKPIAVLLQSISGVSAINPLVAFYDIHGGNREVLLFYFVPDTTRDLNFIYIFKHLHFKYQFDILPLFFYCVIITRPKYIAMPPVLSCILCYLSRFSPSDSPTFYQNHRQSKYTVMAGGKPIT